MTAPEAPREITVHALQIGDRINTAGFEGEGLSGTPLAVRVGQIGLAVGVRYGAVVFLGLTADQEAEFLERLHARCAGKISPYEEEWTKVQIAREGGEPIPVGGPILVSDMSLERRGGGGADPRRRPDPGQRHVAGAAAGRRRCAGEKRCARS